MKKLFLLFLSGIFVLAACRQGTSTPSGLPPIIATDLSGEHKEQLQFEPLKLSVSAQSPNDKGTISYEWFKVDRQENISWLSERSSGEMQVETNKLGKFEFFCRVYHKEIGKTTVYRDSIHQIITIKENPKGITNDPVLTPYIAPIQPITAWKGKEFSLKVEAEATKLGTLSYQWYEVENPQGANPQPVNEATEAIFNSTPRLPKTYYYYCRVKNEHSHGTAIAVSNIVSVEVKKAAPDHAQTPEITVSCPKYTVKTNDSVRLSIDAAVSDGGTLSYQWYTATGTAPATSDTKVANENGGNTAAITVTESNATTKKYYCTVTNTLTIDDTTTLTKEAQSTVITVEWSASPPAVTEPVITYPTHDMTKTVQTGTVFWVHAEAHSVDNGKITYQWYWNDKKSTAGGRKITGATTEIYSAKIDDVKTIYYYCEVTNTKENASSKKTSPFYCYTTHTEKKPAQKPNIITDLDDATEHILRKGDAGDRISIAAESTDGGYLTYQWYKSSEPDATKRPQNAEYLPGKTTPTLSIPTDKAGIFYFACLITNTNPQAKENHTEDKIYSKWYKAEVKDIVDFSSVQVKAVGKTADTIEKNNTATFTVEVLYAPDDAAFAYQWKKGTPPTSGTSSTDTNAEGSSTAASYTTQAVTSAQTITYYCAVTVSKEGLESKTFYSPKFTLTVVDVLPQVPNITGQPTGGVANKTAGVSLTVTATAAGGETRYKWYKSVTNSTGGGSEDTMEISNANGATYKVTDEGTFYYYCEVSNSNDAGKKVCSNPVCVTIYRDASITPVDETSSTDGFGWKTQNWALGNHKVGSNQITFAVYSEHAEQMMLEIYDQPDAAEPKGAFFMEKGADNIWRAKIQTSAAKIYYGYRAWGPNWKLNPAWVRGSEKGYRTEVDSAGNRFNPNKLLADPYSLELSHTRSTNTVSYQTDDTNRNTNNGKDAPKSVVVEKLTTTENPKSSNAAFANEVVYQLHIKGFTGNGVTNIETCTVPEDEKGTYAGAAKMVKYLENLGVNTVLLMPVFESAGYEDYYPANFFAVAKKYAKDKTNPAKEFQDMVKKFHEANIQVFLDMPYNQMGEASGSGSVRLESLRGLDNRTYYGANAGTAADKLDGSNAQVQKLITDSLDYWLTTMGIDGIRYTPLNNDASLRATVTETLKNKNCKCIIETAEKPESGAAWAAWNNGFRDAVRKSINWKQGVNSQTLLTDLMQTGSAVNFAASHTGYRITDTLSYSNVGTEIAADANEWGDSRPLLRRIRYRGLLVLTAFSKGVPMITYGDEFGAAQGKTTTVYDSAPHGVFLNDYAYINRDGICTELGTDNCDDGKNSIYLFAKQLFNLRKADQNLFANARYTFTKLNGDTLTSDDLQCRILITDQNHQNKYCIYVNMQDQDNVALPMIAGTKWTCIINTDHVYEKQSGGLSVTNNIKTDNVKEYNNLEHKLNKFSIAVFKAIP